MFGILEEYPLVQFTFFTLLQVSIIFIGKIIYILSIPVVETLTLILLLYLRIKNSHGFFCNLRNFPCLFFITIGILSFVCAVFYCKLQFLNLILLDTLFFFQNYKDNNADKIIDPKLTQKKSFEIVNKEVDFTGDFVRRRSLFDPNASNSNKTERLFDALDQGYFVLNLEGKLIDANTKAINLMSNLQMKFTDISKKMVNEKNNANTLETMIKLLSNKSYKGNVFNVNLVLNPIDKNNMSPRLGSFSYYKAKIYRLGIASILLIIKEKASLSSYKIVEKVGKILNITLSHELKTLLNAVIGNLTLLEDGINNEHKVYYHLALTSSHILSSRLNDMFDYIQMQEGTFKLHISEFLLEKLIMEIKNIYQSISKQKHLNFNTIIDPDVPNYILSDRLRIMQILLNLLAKTIEYTDYGTIILQVSMKDDSLIHFKVISDGIGMHYKLMTYINPQTMNSIGNTYKDNDNPLYVTENMGEMYLGISQMICQKMGTSLIVNKTKKKESQFSFILPDALLEKDGVQRRFGLGFTEFNEGNKKKKIRKNVSLSDINEQNNNGENDICLLTSNRRNIKRRVSKLFRILPIKKESEIDFFDADIPLESPINKRHTVRNYKMNPKAMPVFDTEIKDSEISLLKFELIQKNRRKSHAQGYPQNSFGTTSSMFLSRIRQNSARRIEVIKLQSILNNKKSVDGFSLYNILVVDDNMMNRFVLKSILKKCGYNSIEAQNGIDAVNMIKSYLNSGTLRELLLVFMDLQMPIMNGIESTQMILSLCSNTGVNPPPIIGVSSDYSEEDRYKFEQSGIKEFVSKPLDKDKVDIILNTYIKKVAQKSRLFNYISPRYLDY